jgi:hypothetical protein
VLNQQRTRKRENDMLFENQTVNFHMLRQQFTSMPQVSKKIYGEAVETMRLATLHFSAGRAGQTAARVLLNAYNGAAYPIDTTDILYLDPDLQNAALTVLIGRIKLNCEPHQFYNNRDAPYRGNEIFNDLAERF